MISNHSQLPKEEIIENAKKWLQSSEGQESIQKALLEVKAITTRLQEDRRVDVKSLNEPFTV